MLRVFRVLNDIYNMFEDVQCSSHPSGELYTNGTKYADIWDSHVPSSEQNSLWYSGLCDVSVITGTVRVFHVSPCNHTGYPLTRSIVFSCNTYISHPLVALQ